MKPVFFTLILVVLVFSSARSQEKTKDVQLGCRTPMFGDPTSNPFATIASALGSNAETKRFRVSWSDNLGSGWDRGTILYDRKEGTLKYYDVGGAGEAGEQYYRKSYLLTGIKEDAFVSMVKKYNNQEQIQKLLPYSFLDTLPAHGYRKYKVVDYKRGF